MGGGCVWLLLLLVLLLPPSPSDKNPRRCVELLRGLGRSADPSQAPVPAQPRPHRSTSPPRTALERGYASLPNAPVHVWENGREKIKVVGVSIGMMPSFKEPLRDFGSKGGEKAASEGPTDGRSWRIVAARGRRPPAPWLRADLMGRSTSDWTRGASFGRGENHGCDGQ